MDDLKTIELKEFENSSEKEVVKLLQNKGKCLYGDILKELEISATRGQSLIYNLIARGIIAHKNSTSYLHLNVNLK